MAAHIVEAPSAADFDAGHSIALTALPNRRPDGMLCARTIRSAWSSCNGRCRSGNCARCAVWIPDPAHEAIRDLARAREDAVNARAQVRQQLKGFLLRHDVRYVGKTAWSKTYYRWLATLNFGLAGAQTAFTEYWQANG